MNYHNITTADMMNGDGLRVVLWLSGCNHHCQNCQNPQTWDVNSGIKFDISAKEELFKELKKDYISGITFSGGDPLHENNINEVLELVNEIRLLCPKKTIWLYTGYTWEEIFNDCDIKILNNQHYILSHETRRRIENNDIRKQIISHCDVLVDGRYIDSLRDVTLHWCGSGNQSVIDIQASINKGEVILYKQD